MRRHGSRRLFKLALPLTGLFFYCIAIHQYSSLCQYPAVYQVACGGGHAALTQEDYRQICMTQEKEESSLCYAFWGKTEGVDVENVQGSRRSSVDVWRVRGRLDILFNGSVNLQETDLQGCYLDAETARELFGSTEVTGSEVTCMGRQFTIRGILVGEEDLLILRPGVKETTDHITLGDEDKDPMTASKIESFLLRYGISGRAVDPLFLKYILQILLLLFPAGLGICLFRELKGGRAEGVRWILLLIMFWLLLRRIEIPETMIPDKWSDFQFWKNWWESAGDNMAAFARKEKTGRELAQIICFLKGAVCAAIPVVIWQIPPGRSG